MPKYILPQKKLLSDYLGNEQIFRGVLKAKESGRYDDRISESSFLEYELPDILIMDAAADSIDGAAENIVPYPEAIAIMDEFKSDHKRYTVDEATVSTFLQDSQILANNFKLFTGNNRYELAFRIYIGHDGHADIRLRVYNLVVVPMCSLRDSNEEIDHDQDREKAVFSMPTASFFALVFHSKTPGHISNSFQQCEALLANKDNVSSPGTLLIYHTFSDLNEFRSGLDRRFPVHNMEVNFGRIADRITTGKKLTVLLSFTNNIGPVLSTVISSTTKTNGIIFDRGDLIPPPPIVDSLFIP
jgi:hypothetical protein